MEAKPSDEIVGMVRRRRTAPLDTTVSRLEAENERLRAALRAAGLAPSTVDAIAAGEQPRPCPAGHGDQCCGYPAACEAALTG